MVLQAEGGRKARPGKGSALPGGEVGQATRSKKFTCLTRPELLGEQSQQVALWNVGRRRAGGAWACSGNAGICRNGGPSGPLGCGAPWRPC